MVPLDPHHQRIRNLPILLGVGFSVVLIVLALLLDHATPASAEPPDLAGVEAQYPNMVGSRIDACIFCHTSSIPNLNPFGAAYLANGRNTAALVAIQNLDSDGDGFTNIQEINALTFPGNPNDHPAMMASATPTQAPSATPLPTMTFTPTPGPTSTFTSTAVATSTFTPTSRSTSTLTPTTAANATSTALASETPVVNTPTPGVDEDTSTPIPTSVVARTPTRAATARDQDDHHKTRTPRATATAICAAPRGDDSSSDEQPAQLNSHASDRVRTAVAARDRSRCEDNEGKDGDSDDSRGRGGSDVRDALTIWLNAIDVRFRPDR